MSAQAGWIGRVREALDRYALASHRVGLRLVPAELGERAGAIGAGLMAWDAVKSAAPAATRPA